MEVGSVQLGGIRNNLIRASVLLFVTKERNGGPVVLRMEVGSVQLGGIQNNITSSSKYNAPENSEDCKSVRTVLCLEQITKTSSGSPVITFNNIESQQPALHKDPPKGVCWFLLMPTQTPSCTGFPGC